MKSRKLLVVYIALLACPPLRFEELNRFARFKGNDCFLPITATTLGPAQTFKGGRTFPWNPWAFGV